MIRVVLVEPEGEYNVGFVARLCKNFDINELYIVNPKCNITNAGNFSAKGKDLLDNASIVSSFDEAIKDTDLKIATSSIADSKGDILRKAIRPWELNDIIGGKKVALIFGRESVGLTREEISKSDFLLYIPASRKYPTLNLSHAVGIVLYELWKTKDSRKFKITSESLALLDKYSRLLYELIKSYEGDLSMYFALKRALIKGVSDEEEAKTIIRFLRKIYTRILHVDKDDF
jgi:TrmH family RNA methyltransferase